MHCASAGRATAPARRQTIGHDVGGRELRRAPAPPAQAPPPPPVAAARAAAARSAVVAAAHPRAARQYQPREEEEEEPLTEEERWMRRLADMRPTTRSVALLHLLRIEQEGAFAGLVNGSPGADADSGEGEDEEGVPRGQAGTWSARLDPRHARAATELVSGATRWRRRLDYTLEALMTSRRLGELDGPVRNALRLALYELAEHGRADYGVTSGYVELVKSVMHQGAANAVNGVLRNAVRALEAGALPQPQPPTKGMPAAAAADALAVGASHPTWLVAAWLRQFGPAATLALMKHNNTRPRYGLRLSPGVDAAAFCRQLAARGVKAEPSRYLPTEFVCVDRGLQALLAQGLVQRGEAAVQDEAAGLVVAALDPRPGESLLDACAAPGGKTLFAAARMRGAGVVTALDLSRSRLAALRRAAQRQPHGGCVRTYAADLRRFATLRHRPDGPAAGEGGQPAEGADGTTAAAAETAEAAEAGSSGGGGGGGSETRQPWHYDRVLLDAPCSGTGVLAKRADLRWRRTPGELAALVALQGELLDAAAALVAPGGLLVYSTCSIEEEENGQQVAAFLQRHPEYELERVPAAVGVPAACLGTDGCLRMLPHVHGTDGAFAARLRRHGGDSETTVAAVA